MPVIPLLIAAAVGTAAFGIVSSNQARKESRKQSQAAQAQTSALEQSFLAEQENLEKSEAGRKARDKQKSRAASATGRRSTLLTSPIGIVGEAEGARKTLLGL